MHAGLRGRYSELLASTELLLLSALRRGLYSAVFVSVLAPSLLPVVLFSFPDFRSLSYPDGGRTILEFPGVEGRGVCYPAKVVEGLIASGNASLEAVILVVEAEPSKLLKPLGLAGQHDLSAAVVLPREVYASLGGPRVVKVLLNQVPRNYAVAGLWGSNVVLLVGSGLGVSSAEHACLVSQRDVLLSILRSAEEDLLSTAALWAMALSLAYLPVLYAAQRRVAESLRAEAVVLLSSGASKRTVLASVAAALALLHVLGVAHVSSLAVVLVYAAWSLLSYVVALPPPALRGGVAWLLAAEALLGVLTAYPASRGAVT
jgi:hypothetical protein